MTVDLLALLDGVRQTGPSQWEAKCPALDHDDRHASLSVSVSRDGHWLVHCHVGCTVEAIVAGVRLEVSDLFADNGDRPHDTTLGAQLKQALLRPSLPSEAELDGWVRELVRNEAALGAIAAAKGWRADTLAALGIGLDGNRLAIPVRSLDGALVTLLRYWPGAPVKMLALKGHPRTPLYCVVDADRPVFVVEGEPDAISLAHGGLNAIGLPGVSKAIDPRWLEPLRGRVAYVLADNDDAGRAWAKRCADLAHSLASVTRVVELRGSTKGYDVGDFLLEHAGDVDHGRAALLALVEHAPLWTPPVSDDGPRTDEADADDALRAIPEYPLDALPETCIALAEAIATTGVPVALLAGPMLTALATAIGGRASVIIQPGWQERAIVWVATIAPPGAGKSPAQTIAYAPLRRSDAGAENDEQRLRVGDVTFEALYRLLAACDGSVALDLDELSQLLRGLGEYKRGGGGDRGRLLAMWSGEPVDVIRVGDGRKGRNAVDLRIARPTVPICGGLQPARVDLLGDPDDGLRPRWLPHVALIDERVGAMPNPPVLDAWNTLLARLVAQRDRERAWTLAPAAHDAWRAYRATWKRQQRGVEPPSVTAALAKADRHLARIALVLAEADDPAAIATTEISAGVLDRAARIVRYTLDCWRALPEPRNDQGVSRREHVMGTRTDRLAAWLEARPGREATRREIQRAHPVAGVRKAGDLDALLDEYAATYPGTVEMFEPPQGGHAQVVVHAPRRRS